MTVLNYAIHAALKFYTARIRTEPSLRARQNVVALNQPLVRDDCPSERDCGQMRVRLQCK